MERSGRQLDIFGFRVHGEAQGRDVHLGLLSIKMYLKPQVNEHRHNREAQGLNSEALQAEDMGRNGQRWNGTERMWCPGH